MSLPYREVVCALRGKAVLMEIGDPNRSSVEVIKGFIWDLLFEDQITLVLIFKDESMLRKAVAVTQGSAPGGVGADTGNTVTGAVPAQGAVPAPEYDLYREFFFKWVRTANIISIESDANVQINIKARTLSKPKALPLYTDEAPNWSMLNNALSKHICAKLKEMGINSNFQGVLRSDSNDMLSAESPAYKIPENDPVEIIGATK